ncbi:MAG: hypothetical protein Q4C57_09235 [Bacillota bacterium]|nr:hypothetical protein [Bacillota bacterium]
MKKITNEKRRNLIHMAAAVLINGYVTGFRKGTILQANPKRSVFLF